MISGPVWSEAKAADAAKSEMARSSIALQGVAKTSVGVKSRICGCPAISSKARFQAGFKLDLMKKDANLALDSDRGQSAGVARGVLNDVVQRCRVRATTDA